MTDAQLKAFYALVVTEPDGSKWVPFEVLDDCVEEIRRLRKIANAAKVYEVTGDLMPLSQALED